MSVPDIKAAVEHRFGMLMDAASYRLSANNPEMWENQAGSVPWAVLDSLSVLPDDTEAAGWLLSETRAQDILCIVLGFRKLLTYLENGNEVGQRYAREAMYAGSLGKAFRVFALCWLNLPLDYRHKSESPIVGAVTHDDLAGYSGVL